MVPSTFDDELRRAFDAFSDRLRSDLVQHLNSAADQLGAAVAADRSAAVAEATAAAREEAQRALADAQARLTETLDGLAAARAQLDEARAQLDGARAEIDDVRGQLDAAEQARALAEQTRAAADEARARAEQARTDAEHARADAEQACAAAGQTRIDAEQARANAERARAEAEQRANALADADAALQAQFDSIQKQYDHLQARHDALQAQHDSLQSAHAALQTSLSSRDALAARDTPTPQADAGAKERLVDAIRAIDRARSLSETLDTLVSCVAREAPRAAVFVLQEGALRGWRFLGFDGATELSGDVRIPLADAGALGDAVRTRTASSTGAAPAFARLPAGGEMLAVPVAIAGEVVAVVYADGGRTHASEARGRHTWSGVVEVLARHAARVLESVLAFRAAQAVTGWAERPGEPAAQGETPHGSPVSGEADEAARRYARLLVSEIKLYHEPEVMEGRRQRDLMSRLGGEIARARALYEERVPPPVRSNADHFNAELIRTLAGGDPSLVGLVDRIEHVEGIEHRASWVE